jgi:hypothetical protein
VTAEPPVDWAGVVAFGVEAGAGAAVVGFGVDAELEAGVEAATLGVDAALEFALEAEPVAVELATDALAIGVGVLNVSELAELLPPVELAPEVAPAAVVETGAAEKPLLTSAANPA